MPVNALSAGETYTEQQTLDDLNTENSNSTNESNATSAEVATDSNASEEASISDISSDDIDASEEKLNNEISLQSNDTDNDEEPSTDNWELGLVFYDSTVDNGKTPLTSIDWDASDGGCGNGTPRVITVQINYKNTNAVTTYQPGEIEIKIPNLMYNQIEQYNQIENRKGSMSYLAWSTIMSANDVSHEGYDWDFKGINGNANYNTLNRYVKDMIFTNVNTIDQTSNFEGSIKIVYTLTPHTEHERVQVGSSYTDYQPEEYDDECTHTLSMNLQASLNSTIKSNTINFDYKRKYTHPWIRREYEVIKKAEKISTYDSLPSDAIDYIWVKYSFKSRYHEMKYPNITITDRYYIDDFPKECCILNASYQVLEPSVNKFQVSGSSSSGWTGETTIYVGYPKSIYNDENKNTHITNTVKLWGRYVDREQEECLAEDTIELNLSDFEFEYQGDLYSISKSSVRSPKIMNYQDIINEWNLNYKKWYINPIAYYTGKPMTLKFGDDVLYAKTLDGDVDKLEDNEYYFSDIRLQPSYLKNAAGMPLGEYNWELWIRYADQNEYVLRESFVTPKSNKRWNFAKEEKVVGFYFIVHDLQESFVANISSDADGYGFLDTSVHLLKKDIPQSGTLYNFDFLQVYFKDKNGSLVLQNEPEFGSYSSFITKEKIAQYDQDTYGTYMQRAVGTGEWRYYNVVQPTVNMSTYKTSSSIIQDAKNEVFKGTYTIKSTLRTSSTEKIYERYWEQYDSAYALQGFRMYDLLPLGMELDSTEDEILNTFSLQKSSIDVYDLEGNVLSLDEIKSLINIDVIKTNNWNNTGRTRICIIVLFDKPVYLFCSYAWNYYFSTTWSYDYHISYDSFLEYGAVWTNYCYGDKLETQEKGINPYYNNKCKDDGTYDKAAIDINENGNISDELAYSKAIITIESVISTHQDVTKYVQTDKSNFSTGKVPCSPDSQYTYKLRVRTGENKVTNLVIYDSIEEYVQDPYSTEQSFITAYGTKKHWNGEFLGVDTSYAENKGYKVKVYYSENDQAGNLSEDTSWKEYFDAIDKSKVKSLAFEYLNKDDETQKAVLPANSQTYVLIRMKSLDEEAIEAQGIKIKKDLSYNGCRTQWNALDDYDIPVDFITGINSNIVKVSLSDYYDLTVNKTWDDEHNKWGLRPDSVDIILKKDGTEVERKQITKDNLSVTFTDLLVEDSDRYTIEEGSLLLYSGSTEYNELEDCYEVTNTLKDDIFKDISGTKTWVNDKESNRPESITIKLLKDGDVYRTTTTNAEKEWKYSFEKVPIYNADETECIYSVEEESVDKYTVQYAGNGKGLTIKFNSQFKTESVSYDYVEIYYKQDGQTFKLGRYGGTDLAGKTVNVPTKDFYLYWRTDGSGNNYYGFSIDSIESADVTVTGTKASLPNYTVTELTGKEYPETAHNPYPNSQNLLWHYTGSFSSDVPTEGLFNIVNTYEGVDAINLSFVKEVEGTDEAFEKLQLKKDALYKFQISMKNRETGNVISIPIDNKNTVTVNEVPVGTYVITEKDDMYFDFVSMEALNSVEGVTFEKVGDDYVLTITEDAAEEERLQVKVNNKIEPDRPYEDKKERVNLFDWTSDENSEEASLLSRIANFFKN